jgi:hypothetical protein
METFYRRAAVFDHRARGILSCGRAGLHRIHQWSPLSSPSRPDMFSSRQIFSLPLLIFLLRSSLSLYISVLTRFFVCVMEFLHFTFS